MKSLKKLLIPAIVLVVLLVAVVIVAVINGKNKDDIEEGSYNVFSYLTYDIQNLTVSRKHKDKIIINSETNSAGDVIFSLDEGMPSSKAYSQPKFNLYLSMLSSYVATGKFSSENRNLEDYGLSNPEYKVVITTRNDEVKVVSFGNDTLTDGFCYMMVDGDSNIYTVPTEQRTYCDVDETYFYDAVNMGVVFNNVSEITFERSTDNLVLNCTPIVSKDDEVSFEIGEPYNISAGEFLATLLRQIGNLDMTSFVKLTDDEIKDIGLDNPSYHFKFTYDDGKVKEIYLSSLHNGCYYGYSSEADDYFEVLGNSIDYINSPIIDYLYSYLSYVNAKEIRQISCVTDDVSFVFDIKLVNNINDEDAELKVDRRNAKVFNESGRCYGAILFESIACIEIGGADFNATPVLENPEMELSFIDINFKKTIIDFVKRDSDSYYCFIDGEYIGYYVFATELYNDGGLNTYNYGIIGAYNLLDKAIDGQINSVYKMKVD